MNSATQFEYVVFPNGEGSDDGGDPPLGMSQHPHLLDPAQSEPVKPKRSHVVAACHFCKGRKMKCDGVKPTCGNCATRSLTCTFPEFVKTRGPNRPKTGDEASPGRSKSARQQSNAPIEYGGPDGSQSGMLETDPQLAGVPYGEHHHQPPPPPPHTNGRRKKRTAEEGPDEDDDEEEGGDGSYGDKKEKKQRAPRKRATMACHSCRARKMKCDEIQPVCGQCARRQLTCQYDDFVRRRGPSKKKKGEEGESEHSAPPHPHMLVDGAQKYMLMDPATGGMGIPVVPMHLPHPMEHHAQMEHAHPHSHGPPPQSTIWS